MSAAFPYIDTPLVGVAPATPVDGAVVKDAVEDKLNIVTGSKGPGKAEIKMDWDPYFSSEITFQRVR